MTLLNLPKNRKDNGFALLELIVVVLVIGILSAIAVPLYTGAQREANIATLKNDVRSSVDSIIDTTKALTFVGDETFNRLKTVSPGNIIAISTDYTDPATPAACVYGVRRFSDNDVVAFHYSSKTGKIDNGDCNGIKSSDGLDSMYPAPSESKPAPSTPAPSNPAQQAGGGTSSPIDPTAIQPSTLGGVKFTPTYMSQSTKISFCYKVTATTESAAPITDWGYTIDLNKGPFWGVDPSTFHSTYGYIQKSLSNGQWNLKGEWPVSSSQPREFGFCSPSTPEPPTNTDWFNVSVKPASDNSNWYAKLDITVTSTSPYPVPWEVTVNFDDYFKSLNGQTPNFTNIVATKVSGNTYRLKGASWNQYVSESEPRLYSTAVSYNPQGKPW